MARWPGWLQAGSTGRGTGMTLTLSDFGRFRRAPAAFPVFDGPAQVRAYWEGLRRNGALPDRSQLDPRGLGGVLDRVFLAERIARGLVQVRIAGSALTDLAGTDLRGLPLSCLFAPEARPVLAEVLEGVANGRHLTTLDLAPDGDRRATAQLALLPLADGREGRLVLGCLATLGRPDRARFQILRRQDERLDLPAETLPEVADLPTVLPLKTRGHLSLVYARD
jgi:hypothetical protein